MSRIAQIDLTTEAFRKQFGSLTAEQLNWKPNESQWSIAQNIDHLIVINESYYPIFEKLRSGNLKTPFVGKVGFLVSLFGKLILKGVQPDRKQKMKTFPIWEPSKSEISGNILERFEAHQTSLKDEIQSLSPYIEKRAVIFSPANNRIVYRLDTALDIIISHEKRHLEQAREVLALFNKQA